MPSGQEGCGRDSQAGGVPGSCRPEGRDAFPSHGPPRGRVRAARVWRLCRAVEVERGSGTAISLVTVFALLCAGARLIWTDSEGYSAFWPANAVMTVALLTLRLPQAVGVLLSCFALNLALNGLCNLSPDEAVLTAILNQFVAIMTAVFLRRYCGSATNLARARRFGTFAVIAVLVSALEAAIGVMIEVLWLGDPALPLANAVQWVMCDALGLVLATPLLMDAVRRPFDILTRIWFNPLSGLLLLVGLAWAFTSFRWGNTPLFLFICPGVALLALAGWTRLALTLIFGVALIAAALSAAGYGPAALLAPDDALWREEILQFYLVSLCLVVLPVGHGVTEWRRAVRRLQQLRARLEYAASHDALTGVMNRARFSTILTGQMGDGRRGALLLVDIDHFKKINDELGHPAGDVFLRQFCARLAAIIGRRDAVVARIGGDEFAILVPHLTRVAEVEQLCDVLLAGLRAPWGIEGEERFVTVSIGAVLASSFIDDPAAWSGGNPGKGPGKGLADDPIKGMVREADIALYAAKAGGRDTYVLSRLVCPAS
ncbi:diguanylate cyclase domain-containing protein [Acidomonas methanolica]|uniref:diguanylate cyclase domain-containing protein n=1 Tax=Acidomonas methanolica TaxID=437 RepID=UPI002119EB2A|nr:diguanylate cyclase [Acidomonas methanolica]MCQ9154062.1 diguanylate cyclase [Acidomonas methanolica]